MRVGKVGGARYWTVYRKTQRIIEPEDAFSILPYEAADALYLCNNGGRKNGITKDLA